MVPESSVPSPIKLRWTEYLKFSNKLEIWLTIRLYLLRKNIFWRGHSMDTKRGGGSIQSWSEGKSLFFFLQLILLKGALYKYTKFSKKIISRKKNLVLHKNLKVFPISIEHKDSPKKDQTFFQHCSRPQELGKL